MEEYINQHKSSPAIRRAEGFTASEQYLKKLCDNTFLSLWSYPNVYRNQGVSKTGEGKEICDLLVVFEDHILIFSDKYCAFPNKGDLSIDWSRWFKRAVLKSAEQVWGAERWIREHPDRLFTDPACEQTFPIELPDPTQAKFHRVVVAHDSTEPGISCQAANAFEFRVFCIDRSFRYNSRAM